VLRLLKHERASNKPLEEVRSDIENILRTKIAHERTMAAAEEIKNKILDGAAAESVVSGSQRVEDYGTLKRTDMNKVDPMIVDAVFQMPYPDNGKPSAQVVNMMSGEIAVVLLDQVTIPDDLTREQIDTVMQQRKSDVANSDFDFALTSIKDAADIERNTSLLQ
jgi:peptidyl-prolyl cis-trans isomerase D